MTEVPGGAGHAMNQHFVTARLYAVCVRHKVRSPSQKTIKETSTSGGRHAVRDNCEEHQASQDLVLKAVVRKGGGGAPRNLLHS